MDSQAIKSQEKRARRQERGEQSASDLADTVGYAAGKKARDSKIHALVDALGLPIRLIHSASVQDRHCVALLLDKVRKRFPLLRRLRKPRAADL